MIELDEHRVYENFDALDTEDHQGWRAADAGLATVTLYRTEYARWTDPDAAEPDKTAVLAVVWKLVEKPCECGSETDGVCVCDDLAAALGNALDEWDVYATSAWGPSSSPWDPADEHLSASATQTYQYERDTQYDYSLHFEGITPEVRGQFMAALGIKQ